MVNCVSTVDDCAEHDRNVESLLTNYIGSDYPFTRAEGVGFLLGKMNEGVKGMFTEAEMEDLYHKNAERLLSYPKVR